MAVTLQAATSAVAAQLNLPGDYGNASGCAYLRTDSVDRDDLRYLTPQEASSYASSCEFVAVDTDRFGNQLAQGICHHEGEETLTAETHIITLPNPAGSIRVYTGTGEVWAELEPCP